MNPLVSFFNPEEHQEVIIPMYGTIHLITLIALLMLIPLMMWQRKKIIGLASNRTFMKSWMISYMVIDFIYWICIWAFQVEPVFERIPLHLCASLSILMPILVLTKQYKAVQFFTGWSVGAGLISFLNPNFIHDFPWSFSFIHYLIRHSFIFALPIFLYIGGIIKLEYKIYLKSIISLIVYACVIFLVDWATGANFMHLGSNNPLAIPFLPAGFTRWPFSLPSFIGVGFILLHLVYGGFKLGRKTNSGTNHL